VLKSSGIEPEPVFILFFAIASAIFRYFIYCPNVIPPFNLLGRIFSRQFILPGFDRVFLTPLAAVLTGIVGGRILSLSGSWHAEVAACVVALIWLVLFAGGPTLQNWTLTGQLRFRPPTTQSGERNRRLRRI
jgi:hypothetical protein